MRRVAKAKTGWVVVGQVYGTASELYVWPGPTPNSAERSLFHVVRRPTSHRERTRTFVIGYPA